MVDSGLDRAWILTKFSILAGCVIVSSLLVATAPTVRYTQPAGPGTTATRQQDRPRPRASRPRHGACGGACGGACHGDDARAGDGWYPTWLYRGTRHSLRRRLVADFHRLRHHHGQQEGAAHPLSTCEAAPAAAPGGATLLRARPPSSQPAPRRSTGLTAPHWRALTAPSTVPKLHAVQPHWRHAVVPPPPESPRRHHGRQAWHHRSWQLREKLCPPHLMAATAAPVAAPARAGAAVAAAPPPP